MLSDSKLSLTTTHASVWRNPSFGNMFPSRGTFRYCTSLKKKKEKEKHVTIQYIALLCTLFQIMLQKHNHKSQIQRHACLYKLYRTLFTFDLTSVNLLLQCGLSCILLFTSISQKKKKKKKIYFCESESKLQQHGMRFYTVL